MSTTEDPQPSGDFPAPLGYMTVEAYCCRTWDIFPGLKIGRCGYCGCVPEVLR